MNARYAWTVLAFLYSDTICSALTLAFLYSYTICSALTLTCDLFDRNVSIMEDLILVVLSTLPLVMEEIEKV